MIAALFGWTKMPQWALELAALGLVGGAVWFWHHETYESGIKAEVAKVQAQAVQDTAKLTAKANAAEHTHDQELAILNAYRDAHPEQPVRLCLSTSARVQTAAAQPIGGSAVAGAGPVQPVSAGDSGGGTGGAGPDISGLLEALAARADQVSAQARELQGRDAS